MKMLSLALFLLSTAALASGEAVSTADAPAESRYGTFTANGTATSDYIFRGQTSTDHRPALQVGGDWTHSSGAYAGVWGTNVSIPGSTARMEGDVYGGYNHAVAGDLSAGLGLLYYSYHPDDTINTLELPLQLSWNALKLGASYSPHWGGASLGHAWYLSAGWTQALPWKLSLGLNAGYSMFAADLGFNDYADFRTGMSRDILGVTCDISEYFVSKRQFNGADDARTVLSLSKSI